MTERAERMVLGICTFNRGGRILETLRAIAAMDRVQTSSGARISRLIVVDNNSTDDTAAIVDGFAAATPAIPIERVLEKEQGLSAARKRLFRETDEEIVAFIDDDVIADPAWGRMILGLFDDVPRAGAAGGRVTLHWEFGPTPLARRYQTLLAFQEMGDARVRVEGHEAGLVGAAISFRRRALVDSGWMDRWILRGRTGAELTSGEDTELCIRIRQAGWELWYEGAARMQHLIPKRRQSLDYLSRLAEGIGRSNPSLKWLANGQPDADWARRQMARVRWRRWRTALLEWRPARRVMRLAERRGRLKGWEDLVALLDERDRSLGGGRSEHSA